MALSKISKLLMSSSARTADTYASDARELDGHNALSIYVDVTTVAAGGTLDVTIQDSPDGGTTWYTHTAFTQITAAGTHVKRVTNIGPKYRVSCVVGTNTVTFSVRDVATGA